MSRVTKIPPTVVGLAQPAATARTSADIIVLPADKIGRKRLQRVDPLARACGSDAPDLKAKAPKQTEKRVHLFRKTVATQAMQLPGMDVLTVSRLLRHKSVRTLEVHYLATPHKRLRQAANDIGEVLLARRGGGAS